MERRRRPHRRERRQDRGPHPPDRAQVLRLVALGASNLTRGLPALVEAACDRYGDGVELVAALGVGRSYGAKSRVLVRSLPSILECGLWRGLERMPAAPLRGLITDVGNDIVYGYPPAQILEWVEKSVDRLQQAGATEVVITDLPLASLRRLSRARFLFFRSVLYPPCRLSFEQALDVAERVVSGLEELAKRRGLTFFRLRPEWYGFDPIHFRPGVWGGAWQQILEGGPSTGQACGRASALGALRLWWQRPEREWLAGFERTSKQTGLRAGRGARVWLY